MLLIVLRVKLDGLPNAEGSLRRLQTGAAKPMGLQPRVIKPTALEFGGRVSTVLQFIRRRRMDLPLWRNSVEIRMCCERVAGSWILLEKTGKHPGGQVGSTLLGLIL